MSWGPIDPDWGEGWEDFDVDPFVGGGTGDRRSPGGARVVRLPRVGRDRRGRRFDESLTAPVIRVPPTPPVLPPPLPTPTITGPAGIVMPRTTPLRPRPTAVGPRSEPVRPLPAPGWHPAPSPRRAHRAGAHIRPAHPGRRNLALRSFLLVLLLAVVAKLVHVQVIEPDRFVAVGKEQRLRSIELPANRGRILDRQGYELALSVLRPTAFADPSQIEDPYATAAILAPVLDVDPVALAQKLARDNQFVFLARRIDDDLASRVVALDLDGIHLMQEPARFTPSGSLARALIGRVASDESGSTGIEFLYDDVLTGTPGQLSYERARDGGTIAAGGQSRIAPVAGSDVVLTIDRSLQYEAERLLSEQVDAMGAKGGMAIVSQPATGEVLAMANITRNDENRIITAGANRAMIDVFEPGSVNKVITISAALEEGLVEPETAFPVPWRYRVSDHVFSDDHAHPEDPMTVTEILAKSSNVGTIMLGERLGPERIDSYLRAFGFGEKTSLGFRNESRGILLPVDDWSGTSIGSIPIGQGIAVTAMQMLNAYNVIANDGLYIEPHVVAATVAADGTRADVRPRVVRRVVSEQTAQQVRDMLVEAVEDGTGRRAQVGGYTVGGKTGTARKPQDTGGYTDEAGNYHYVAAFTGMVPAEDPQLSIIVVVDEPTATIYGGSAAAPVFADLAKFALNRFRIPPAA